VLNVIAAAATVVAAVGALVTVMYARRTVLEGRAAHSEEMDERRRALVAEIRLQRLVHASRLTDLLMAIACAAPARPFRLSFASSLQCSTRSVVPLYLPPMNLSRMPMLT